MKFFVAFIFLPLTSFGCDYLSQSGCHESQRCIYIEKPDTPVCLESFNQPYPLVSFPFGSRRVVTCDQGPHMAGESTHSHAWLNSMDALDLRTRDSESAGKIYAGMSGRAIIFKSCKTKNDQCGAGFGNQVKIFNSKGYLLFYAHLEEIYIKNNQEVKEGDLIGLEGNTGWTGKENRHLHMSVHAGWQKKGIKEWSNLGWLPRSIPFEFKVQKMSSGLISVYSTKSISCIRRKFNRFWDAAVQGI